jgi:thiol:disulfide interchange protein
MAQADDRSTIAMPKALLIAAVVLLAARAIAWAVEFSHPPLVTPMIAWQSPASLNGQVLPANKLMLYEFYADWCGPCKRMESSALTNNQVRELVTSQFIPIRITDRIREDGHNPDSVTALQKKYRVFAFPTLVVVDPSGEAVGSLVGSCSSLTTYRFLSRSLHAKGKPVKS